MPKFDQERRDLELEGKKRCYECQKIMDLNKFYKWKTRYSPRCKECHRAFNKARYIPKGPTENQKLLPKGKLRCSGCGSIKRLEEFNSDKSRWTGKNARCRLCFSDEKKNWYQENKEIVRERTRSAHLKKSYGMTSDDYDRMLAEQGGLCAICKSSDPKTAYGRFSIDHCHETGKVRKLLCNPCNVMLGSAYEDPEVLRRGALYLEEFINGSS